MNDDYINGAIRRSSEDFVRLVWPAFGRRFGQPVPVESVTESPFAKELDVRAGIDSWVLTVDGHIRGLASRVQWADRSYETFTVRVRTRFGRPTEFQKRRAEIERGNVVTPHYMCHAYIAKDRSRLVAAALARTKDVIAAVHFGEGYLLPRNDDGSQGWAVPWVDLQRLGAPVEIWRQDDRGR